MWERCPPVDMFFFILFSGRNPQIQREVHGRRCSPVPSLGELAARLGINRKKQMQLFCLGSCWENKYVHLQACQADGACGVAGSVGIFVGIKGCHLEGIRGGGVVVREVAEWQILFPSVQPGSPGLTCTPCAQRMWFSASQGGGHPHQASVTSHLRNKDPDRGPIRTESRTAVFRGTLCGSHFLTVP